MVSEKEEINPAVSFVRRAVLIAVAIVCAELVIAFATGHAKSIVSLASGFAIATASFLVLSMVIIRSVGGGGKGLWIALLGVVKMAVIGAVLWWLMSYKIVEPIAFLLGFSTMVTALIVEGLLRAR